MAANARLHIGLPGVPEGPDQDLDESPAKKSKQVAAEGMGGALTMSSFKDMLSCALREQSDALLQAQQMQITTSLRAFEERQTHRMERIEEHAQTQASKVDGLESQLREMNERLAKVEARPAAGGGGNAGGPDRRSTLVFGGWAQNTRRHVLLEQLRQGLQGLQVWSLLDTEPFCTGARRSVALCSFRRRSGEAEDQPRARMMQVLQTVNTARVTIEGAVKPLWCSFSKSPEERGRAALASVVRKVVLRFAPERVDDLDIEYTTGRTWIREDQLTGMGEPGPEVKYSKEVTTRAGRGWIDEGTLARWMEVDLPSVQQEGESLLASGLTAGSAMISPNVYSGSRFSLWGWNVGGADMASLPKAVRDSAARSLEKDDLVVLQEVPREKQGWTHQELAGRKVVTHRAEGQWRGTGLWYDPGAWCVLRKLRSERGTWFKVRHLERPLELWIGTAHFSPGVTVAVYEDEVHEHFRHLPQNAHRVAFQGDVNSAFGWARSGEGITEVAKEGKSNILHKVLVERGLSMVPPSQSQLQTPTSRPRQEGRQGQCIDIMAVKHMRVHAWNIHEESFMTIGTDHELTEGSFVVDGRREFPRVETKPRVWTGGVSIIESMDQGVVEDLARRCTRPVRGQGYRDPDNVRKAFKAAKASGSSAQWKSALKLRREARQQWELQRLERASQGEWHCFRALKPRRHQGWDIGFAEAQVGDPHRVVHEHLAGVYKGRGVREADVWRGDVRAFTMEELRLGVSQMKRGKAVGSDLTSTELLLGIMEVKGGPDHLLEWYNRILVTGQIPAKWNEPIMILLPKVHLPTKAKELRPIAMGSSVSKLFSRLLLNRAIQRLRPQTYAQCAGPGRQTSDFLYTIIRLFELTREWGNTLVVFKLDLEKAFDSLDREMLLSRLEQQLGPCAELTCWRNLLRETTGRLQTPWGSSRVPMERGIKQGAVESPVIFAYIAELVLSETMSKYTWRGMPPLFSDLPPEEMLFMDDGLLWNGSVEVVQTRTQQLSVEFARYGLRMNPGKCQLYVSPNVLGDRHILLNGSKIEGASQLEVMGIVLRVGMSMYELVSPAATRARSKFWELKHILRAKGYMKNRARVMQRVVGATALWFICCVPPDKATMTALNSTQLQLMVWLLRFAKAPTESWEDFRKRAFRGARAALNSAGLERWSTLWLRRYWQYAGHRVRTVFADHPPISCEFEHFRTLPWWNHQKSLPQGKGIKHRGHHYARLTQLERSLDHVAGHPWRALAHDRRAWKSRENAWVEYMDDTKPKYAPGRVFDCCFGTRHVDQGQCDAGVRVQNSVVSSNGTTRENDDFVSDCAWFRSVTGQLDRLRQLGRGREPMWLAVLARIRHRQDPAYKQWCGRHLRPLRAEFGPFLNSHQHTRALSPDEVDWARRVEHAAAQDFYGHRSPVQVVASVPQDTVILANHASAPSPDLPYGLFHAQWVNPTTGEWGVGTPPPGPPAAELEEEDLEETSDQASLMSLWSMARLVYGAVAFDRAWEDGHEPGWFDNEVEQLEMLADKGVPMTTITREFRQAVESVQDDRFHRENALVLDEVYRRLAGYPPQEEGREYGATVRRPTQEQVTRMVHEVLQVFKNQWYLRLCPIAQEHHVQEQHLRAMGLLDGVVFEDEYFNREAVERARLSRSRSPHRRSIAMARARTHPANGADYLQPEDSTGQSDDVSLFQIPPGWQQRWADLMRQLEDWFMEGREVGIAVRMLRQRVQDSGDQDYIQWAEEPLLSVGWGNPNAQGLDAHDSPTDFFEWSNAVEEYMQVLYRRDATEEDLYRRDETGTEVRGQAAPDRSEREAPQPDSVSLMADRYQFGRRRIRDSRTPRRATRQHERSRADGGRGGRGGRDGNGRPREGRAGGPSKRCTLSERPPMARPSTGSRGSGDGIGEPTVPSGAASSRDAVQVSPLAPDLQQPMTSDQAVYLWRHLLFDKDNCGPPLTGNARVPDNFLPRRMLQEISTHHEAMSQHNRAISTLALITVIRYLMAEVSRTLDVADALARSQQGDMVEVEVDGEEADTSLLMQKFALTGGRDTKESRGTRALLRLHKELLGQTRAAQLAHVRRLQLGLPSPSATVAVDPWREQLEALLVALGPSEGEAVDMGHADEVWFGNWVNEITAFVPNFQEFTEPIHVETQTTAAASGDFDRELEMLLEDEESERNWRAQRAAEEAHEQERQREFEASCARELVELRADAKAFRDWEQEQMNAALARPGPSKRRCVMTIEASSGSSDKPRMLHTFEVDVPMNGSAVQLSIRATMEPDPEDVTTQAASPAPIGDKSITDADQGPRAHEHGGGPPTGIPDDLSFRDYQGIYEKWRAGTLTMDMITAQYGHDVAELLQTQQALVVSDSMPEGGQPSQGVNSLGLPAEAMDSGEDLGPPTSPLMAAGADKPRFCIFESVYGQWKQGLRSSQDIRRTFGETWLILFAQWKLWGLQAIEDRLGAILDMEVDPREDVPRPVNAEYDEGVHRCSLKIPFRVIRHVYLRWHEGLLADSTIHEIYGDLWMGLFRRIRSEGLSACREVLSEYVVWEPDDLLEVMMMKDDENLESGTGQTSTADMDTELPAEPALPPQSSATEGPQGVTREGCTQLDGETVESMGE
ncbi:unnamed protein product [Symbiodinium sp. CCMP2592]|nr:unnamed protein product [Symbiodinium sp. CCMP2592]